MYCDKCLIFCFCSVLIILIIAMIIFASNSSEYQNFIDISKWYTKSIKGLVELLTLETITAEPGHDKIFALNFKKYEIGITLGILGAIILALVIVIILANLVPKSIDTKYL